MSTPGEWCDTFGCENPPAEGGYCRECLDISPTLLDGDDDNDEPTDSPDTPRKSVEEPGPRDAKPTTFEGGGSASLSPAAFDPIADPEFAGTPDAVRDHYQQSEGVLGALENVGDFPTMWFLQNRNWYTKRYAEDLGFGELDAGHRAFQRPHTLERDGEDLIATVEADPDDPSWRSAYLVLPWKTRDSLAGAYLDADRYEAGDWFDAGEVLPEYADIRALPFWIDVDLADDRDDALDPEDETEYGTDLKARRGDLDPRERRIIERAFEEIVAEVAAIYDLSPEAIAAFDSGGGFYPFGPAAATIPVAERYDDEARERLFDEFTDRMNAYVVGDADTPGTVEAVGFGGIIPRVERKVPGAKYLLDADALLNKNRQTKAPGSIHKTHDVVVTPLRDESGTVDYTPTTVSEFATDDALRERTAAETQKFTANTPEARACVEPLVTTLFPEYADREDLAGWEDALDAWLTDDWRCERERIHATARDDKRRRARREERREELADELDREPTDDEVSAALADQQVTAVRQDVFGDLDRIDVGEVIRNYAADEWDTSNRGRETTFDPSWRESNSGMSCAVPNGSDTFIDNKASGGGGPAKAYALGTRILPQTKDAAAMPLRGRKWGESVDGLRSEGYDIRVYVPEAGSEDSNDDGKTPLGALRRAAVALDVCSPDGFKQHETDEGETYLGFDRETFNDVLDALDVEGIDHGREHIDAGDGGARQYGPEKCAPPTSELESFDREEYRERFRRERYDAFLDGTGPHVWADDAGTGKSTGAELAADERDRPYLAAFDKHAKAHEARTDTVTPDKFPLKGGEQPVHDCCMNAKVAAHEATGETPYCPEHGHRADWPRMCPIYERSKDDPLRKRHEALVGLGGQLFAHLKLGLRYEDEHPWHGGQCWWGEQFGCLLDEDGNPNPEVPRIAGVHEYQLLKSATEGRDVIVDESPRTLATEQRVTVEKLAHARVRLEGLADVHEARARRNDPDGDGAGVRAEDLRTLAGFSDDLMSALADDDPTTLADLDSPDIRPVTWRDYHGVNSEHYTEREDYAEPLAKVKLAYNEGLVRQWRDADGDGGADLPTAPFCIDAVFAAAAKAGSGSGSGLGGDDGDDVRRAIAVPPVLDACPWCGSALDGENGARVCASDECDWNERKNTITKQGGERARAAAWADDDPEHLAPGEKPALVYGKLPDTDELPSNPLVLDATATREKIAGVYGARTENVEVAGDTPLDLGGKLHLTQVVGGRHGRGDDEVYHAGGQYHKQTILDTPSVQRRIQITVEHVCERHDRPLFGIQKDLIPVFDWPDNAVVLHYGGARGLNREQCDAVCCIGAPHPDVEAIRREAELLALDHPDLRVGGDEYSTRRNAPNEPIYRKLRYADENGDGLAVPTKAFSGLVGALFHEAREKELEQFVHRIRPLLVKNEDGEPTKHAYLLTDVPTDLPVDEVAGFEELADPLAAFLPVPEGGVELLRAVRDVAAGDGPDGFRAEALLATSSNGYVENNKRGLHRLARLAGITARGKDEPPCYETVNGWVNQLESVGLLDPEEYEQRQGVAYAADPATLKKALQVLSCNGVSKVAAVRRFSAKVRASDGGLDWLSWAEAVFDLAGDRCEWDPPPNPAG